MKTTFLSLFKRLFSKKFWIVFIPLIVVALILFFLEYGRYVSFQPGFVTKHFLLSLFALISWSFCISLSIRVLGIRKTLLVICLTLVFIGMDYANFSEFTFVEDEGPIGARRQSFVSTYFHALTFASFFLIVYLFSFCSQSRFPSIFRTFLFYLFFLFPLAVIGNMVLSGTGLNEDAMIAILQTNRQEAFHYFFGINNGFFLLLWIFLSALVLWFVGRFAFVPFKDRIKRRKVLAKSAAFCCMAALFPCVAMGVFGSMYYYYAPRMYRAMNYPIAYSRDLKKYNKNRDEYIQKLQERLSSLDKGECFSGKYLVIAGESLNRNYMGCYGYSKNTTPFQSGLMNDDGFYLFRQCFSCHVQTPRVFLLLLTSLNQYNGKGYEISDAVSIIDLVKMYQYQTGWLSGQVRIANSNSSISALADSADYVYYSDEKTPYRDLDVVKYLGENKILEQDRSLTFVHLNGNHYPYALSYPPETSFDEPDLSFYEKSVFFNDTVISKLYDLARANEVDVLLYVSDHSEAISAKKGHDSRCYLQEMAEIPLWIYLSEKYRKEHPEIAERLRVATGQVFTNDLVFDLILYLMGINNEFVDMTLVPGSDDYRINEENARTVYGQHRITINKPENGKEERSE